MVHCNSGLALKNKNKNKDLKKLTIGEFSAQKSCWSLAGNQPKLCFFFSIEDFESFVVGINKVLNNRLRMKETVGTLLFKKSGMTS